MVGWSKTASENTQRRNISRTLKLLVVAEVSTEIAGLSVGAEQGELDTPVGAEKVR